MKFVLEGERHHLGRAIAARANALGATDVYSQVPHPLSTFTEVHVAEEDALRKILDALQSLRDDLLSVRDQVESLSND